MITRKEKIEVEKDVYICGFCGNKSFDKEKIIECEVRCSRYNENCDHDDVYYVIHGSINIKKYCYKCTEDFPTVFVERVDLGEEWIKNTYEKEILK